VKIDTNQIPSGGLTLTEEFAPSALDLETETIKFRSPIRVKADVSRITNAVSVHLYLNTILYVSCSRCLNEFDIGLDKEIEVNYPVDKQESKIDLNPDIRDQIILDYPIKPLCNLNCKGLCAKCGKNLNEGGCSCATT
jgi:uncharacterized protein